MDTQADNKSGQVVAKHGPGAHARFHVDYWKRRIYHKTFTRDGERHEVAEWSIRLQHLGRREAFALGTNNAAVGATKAKEIAMYLEANGWESTLAKFKPDPTASEQVCTVGEFLKEVEKRSHLKPITVRRYAVKLRKIVADVAKIDAGLTSKAKRQKYDYITGGRERWLEKVDGQRLSTLSADVLNEWRNRYVAKAGSNPVERKSAERSSASILRNARALFSDDILPLLKANYGANPFSGVKLKDPGPQRYQSQVNADLLLVCAERELRVQQPNLYLALFLCLYAGLRRKEADLLMWAQIDFQNGRLHVRRTEYFSPKTDHAERPIDLSEAAINVLREFHKARASDFVLAGNEPNPDATYDYYRCDRTWRELIVWLRSKGYTARAANHMLRKESGSLIAAEYGIEAARQHLGHADIRITSAVYVAKKKRVEIMLPIGGQAVAS